MGSRWMRAKALIAAYSDEWTRVRCMSKAAALAFYMLFSLAPLLLLVVIVGALFVDSAVVREALLMQTRGMIGEGASKLFAEIIDRAQRPGQGIPALFGMALLLFAATTVFAELKDSLDEIFRVAPAQSGGLWAIVRTRLSSLALIGALVVLLLASLAAEALLTSAVAAFGPGLGQRLLSGRVATFALGSAGSFALFLAIYAFLPARRMGRRALVFGALASAVLFTLGRIGIGFYLSHSDAVAAFGASGSLVVFLLWIYYSSLAFFAGAIAVQVYEQPFAIRAIDDGAAVAPNARTGGATTPRLDDAVV